MSPSRTAEGAELHKGEELESRRPTNLRQQADDLELLTQQAESEHFPLLWVMQSYFPYVMKITVPLMMGDLFNNPQDCSLTPTGTFIKFVCSPSPGSDIFISPRDVNYNCYHLFNEMDHLLPGIPEKSFVWPPCESG